MGIGSQGGTVVVFYAFYLLWELFSPFGNPKPENHILGLAKTETNDKSNLSDFLEGGSARIGCIKFLDSGDDLAVTFFEGKICKTVTSQLSIDWDSMPGQPLNLCRRLTSLALKSI
jgi:hypothetical protein